MYGLCCLLVPATGSPAPTSSPQKWQQQQQQALLPQQQQQQEFSSISMTGPLPMRLQPTSLPAAGDGPSLDHPSTIPLSIEDDTVQDASGRVLLDRLHPNMALHSSLSQYGALVLGAASEQGAAHAWDLTVGRVRRRAVGGL